MKTYYIYILTNHTHTTLYIGLTSQLKTRIYHHRQKLIPGFTSKYNTSKLIYYEVHPSQEEALIRERRLKKWKRQWKEDLINQDNPKWNDLYSTLESDF